ncbi:MAG: 50S ribosomal protein L19 [Candidatus Brocadiae bacterium]|nr:50S ribosomal protein L19 [Candidatus Brocadiia bacterium]
MNLKLDAYAQKYMKKNIPHFEIGDNVDVILKIVEGDKERKQTFNGTVIAISGSGINYMFTVRRIVGGEGVERTFPIHSPKLVTVRVRKRGKIRRAKLYYLRDRVGKGTKLKEKIWLAQDARVSAELSEAAAKEFDSKAEPKAETKK